MNNVNVVLKSGGVYDVDYVHKMYNMVKRNLTVPFNFNCLTDFKNDEFDPNIQVIQLQNSFKGWWSKVELFRIDLFKDSNNFFLDLDTVIVNNIDFIFEKRIGFAALRDFNRYDNFGSGLMVWYSNEQYPIYTKFLRNYRHIMDSYRFGDQEWIEENIKEKVFLQDLFPKKIISYKKHYLTYKHKEDLLSQTSIVCFHGQPKPNNCNDNLIQKHWR